MTDGAMSIEIAQLNHKRFETKQNKDLILERIERSESDLIIFPEMFLTGYSLGSEIPRYAQDRDSPLIGEIADRAKDQEKYLVIG